MVSLFKLGETIKQTDLKGGKSKRSKYHCSIFLFHFSAPAFLVASLLIACSSKFYCAKKSLNQ